jgi:predicted RNA-binding protein YlqC (UPF0109 family)
MVECEAVGIGIGDGRSRLLLLARAMVSELVDSPELVMIRQEAGEPDYAEFTVAVAHADLGKVIGKQGRTARALRTIIGATAAKYGLRYEVNFVARAESGAVL